jgi:acetyl esterase/lipase
MRDRWRWALNALLGFSLAGCNAATPLNVLARREGVDVFSSLAYADGPRQTLDIYRPRAAAGAPVIVFFYGGSWQEGNKETYLFVASALARKGYVTVVPDYRVYPKIRFPDFLDDGAQAVGWVAQHAAKFGGDPARMILMGHSAGAHIAAMLALDDQWLGRVGLHPRRDIAGLIGVAGPYDFLPIRDPALKLVFGGDDRAITQPITFVRGGEAPALLLTGGADTTVDPRNSARLASKLRAVGSDVQEIVYPRVAHLSIIGAFAPVLRFLAPVLSDVDAFIARLPERRASGAAGTP